MCAVLNNWPSKFPFLTIDKMCAILNDVKCAVVNGKCAVLNDDARFGITIYNALKSLIVMSKKVFYIHYGDIYV